nr:unnamed protein product [Callosobruchus chinensis]
MLQDSKFVFWLIVFHRILPHADILYNQLQKTVTDPVQIHTAITCFEDSIKKERNNIETIESEITDNYVVQSKRRRMNENPYISRTVAAKEVCDTIITHVKHLNASIPFAADRFLEMEKTFETLKHLEDTVDAYPFLDKVRLQTELELIYRRPDFRNISGAIHLLKFITDNNLQDVFSATFALLQIIVTIPMTTAGAERSFSTLKRIKTFLRSSMNQERLTALAMLSIERQFIQDLPDFNEAVITKFAEMQFKT